jgi:hypothetical protein
VALVDAVTDGLAHQMVADGVALQPVLVEGIPALLNIAVVGERLVHLEVVAPAGEFHAVIAEGFGLLADDLKGQIGPLAGKEGNGSWHEFLLGV